MVSSSTWSPAAGFKKVMRRAVLAYSIKNRRAKAERIAQWMAEHRCETVLFVGTLGRENLDANTAIVEDRIADVATVKMGINVEDCDTPYPFTRADARDMPFEDNYVDFVLANAIIEHVGDEADQRRFVAEHNRVARCWVITTPNRWFPVESHTSTVFVHWSPRWRASRTEFTRLLSLAEFRALLPTDAVIRGHWWSPTFSAYRDAGFTQSA